MLLVKASESYTKTGYWNWSTADGMQFEKQQLVYNKTNKNIFPVETLYRLRIEPSEKSNVILDLI